MPKLNDTQTLLLSHASQREILSLYPLPDGKAAGPRVIKAIAALIATGLAEGCCQSNHNSSLIAAPVV